MVAGDRRSAGRFRVEVFLRCPADTPVDTRDVRVDREEVERNVGFNARMLREDGHFLLQEAQFTIMGFIKGPVCRGQIALNVIRDNFWVVFSSPTFDLPEEANAFVAAQEYNLRMPVQAGSNAAPFSTWIKYADSQEDYLKAKSAALAQHFPDGKGLDIDLIWDGFNSWSKTMTVAASWRAKMAKS